MKPLPILLLPLAVLATGAAAQTITVVAQGKQLSMANPELRERWQDLNIRTKHSGDPRCVATGTQELTLDANCVVDSSRTYTTNTTPQCPAAFGQGGPGYGIVVNSCQAHDGSGSHSFDAGSGRLTSTIEVCRKKGTTQRGWYEARHLLYMKCATLANWSQTYGPFTIPAGTGWQFVQTLPPPPPGTQNVTYSISVSPQTAALQSGLFSGNPNVSGDKGLNLWVKPGNNNDLQITALEVTQGIQNLANEMPLVARRRTIVRAYIRSTIDNVNGVGATLSAFRNGQPLGAPVAAENSPAIRTTGGTRMMLDDAFWFLVPPDWRDPSGQVKLVAAVDPNNTVPELDETNNSREATVTFASVPPMMITGVPLHMHVDGDKSKPVLTYLPTDQTFWRIAANLLRFHPTWDVWVADCGTPIQYPDFHGAGREWDMTNSVTQGLVLYRVAWTRAWSGCGPPIQHWIGLVHPQVNTDTVEGIAVPLQKSSWVRMRSDGNNVTPWRVGGGETMAHELAHNVGLPHVKCTGDEGFPTNLYPHPAPDCRLAEGEDGYYGLDVYYDLFGFTEPAVISNDPNAPNANRGFPMMGYKTPGWADPFDYCLLLGSAGVGCNPLAMARAAAGLLLQPTPTTPPVVTPPKNGYLMVGGVYDARQRQLAAFDVMQVERASLNALSNPESLPSETARQMQMVITQLDADRKEIATSPINMLSADGDPAVVPFLVTVPMAAGVQGAQVRVGRTVLGQRLASPGKPVVRLFEPNGGVLTADATIRWTAQDGDGDKLTFMVLYSPDGGRTWRPLASGIGEESIVMPEGARLPGSANGVLRVIASDGFHTSWDDSDAPLSVPTSPPVPSILQPSGLAIAEGRTLNLQGSATDIDEGAITDPKQFRWLSDRDGPIGRGRELFTRTLSRGVHLITLEVRDAEARVGSTSIQVYVGVRQRRTTTNVSSTN